MCHREFRHKNSLVRHMVQHAGERPFHCQFCDYTFATLAKQRDHMRKKHPMLMHKQQLDQQLRVKARLAANAQLPAAMRHYQPIAPAPSKSNLMGTLAPPPPIAPKPVASTSGFPSIYQQRQHQLHQLQQQLMHQQPSLPILAQGPNGQMLLITNPNPMQPQVNNQQQSIVMGPNGILLNGAVNQPLIQQQQQPLIQHQQHAPLVLNSNGTLTTLGQSTNPTQPLFVQPPPPATQTLLAPADPASSATPASSVMSSILSPREAAMLTAPTPEAPTPEPSKEPLLDIPKRTEVDDDAQLELTNEDGSVTLASPDKIVFELSDKDNSKSHMTMTTDNGLTVKLDILERAMLEIPELEGKEEAAVREEEGKEKEEEKEEEAPNEPSRAQSGRENDKIEEEEEEEEVNEISDDDSAATTSTATEEEEDTDSIEASPKGGMETEEESATWTDDEEEEEEEEKKGGALLVVGGGGGGGGESQQTNLVSSKTDERDRLAVGVAKKTMEPIIKEKEPEETTFECEKCGKKYKFLNFLKVHQRRPCT